MSPVCNVGEKPAQNSDSFAKAERSSAQEHLTQIKILSPFVCFSGSHD
jgi:hypothetical protein